MIFNVNFKTDVNWFRTNNCTFQKGSGMSKYEKQILSFNTLSIQSRLDTPTTLLLFQKKCFKSSQSSSSFQVFKYADSFVGQVKCCHDRWRLCQMTGNSNHSTNKCDYSVKTVKISSLTIHEQKWSKLNLASRYFANN